MATAAEIQKQIDAAKAAMDAKEAQINANAKEQAAINKQLKDLKAAGKGSSPEYAALSKQYNDLEYKSSLLFDEIRGPDNRNLEALYADLSAAKDAEESNQAAAAAQDKKTKEAAAQQNPPKPTTTQTNTGDNKAPEDNSPKSTTSETNADGTSIASLPEVVVTATQEKPTVVSLVVRADGPGQRWWNPLSEFSSYTYNISLYGITPDAYNNWVATGTWVTKDLSLLVQSGGMNKTLDSPRNQFFNLDFSIDDLEIITMTNAKSTRFAGNQSNFRFKIYEQFGVSFLSKLTSAQIQIQQNSKIPRDIKQQIQALQCPFLVVIRFYGYDAEGNLMKSSSSGTANTKTDSKANFERAFPVILTKVNFKIDGKVTVYDVEAKMLNELVGYGVQHGVLKNGFEISADTVGNAIDAVIEKINKQQQDLITTPPNSTEKPRQEKADVYKVVFEDSSGIDEELIVPKDYYAKEYSQTARVERANQVNIKTASKDTQTVVRDKRLISFASGESILTAIEKIITQSTFVKSSLDKLEKEELQKTQPTDSDVETPSEKLDLYWYNIKPSTKIIDYDKIRNVYVHEITYYIIQYRLPHIQTVYLNKALKYYGPHKVYNYYYSGNNNEILDYQGNFNLAYYNIGSLASNAAYANNPNDVVPNSPEPGQNADPTGKLPGSNEIVNSLRSYLYSPTDLLNVGISILGDPDYLMPSQAGDADFMFKAFYGPDFTINPNSGQVFIEIGFKQAEDYDNDTGVLNPKDNIVFWTYPQGSDIEKQTQGRMVYMLTQVTSKFYNGLFRQDLKSVIPSFLNQPGANSLRADENQSQAEVKRLSSSTSTSTQNQTTTPDVVKPNPPAVPVKISPIIMNNVKNVTGLAGTPAKSTANTRDDNIPSDPTGTSDAAAIMQASEDGRGKEQPKTTSGFGSFLGSVFGSGQNAGKGRGAVRNYNISK